MEKFQLEQFIVEDGLRRRIKEDIWEGLIRIETLWVLYKIIKYFFVEIVLCSTATGKSNNFG